MVYTFHENHDRAISVRCAVSCYVPSGVSPRAAGRAAMSILWAARQTGLHCRYPPGTSGCPIASGGCRDGRGDPVYGMRSRACGVPIMVGGHDCARDAHGGRVSLPVSSRISRMGYPPTVLHAEPITMVSAADRCGDPGKGADISPMAVTGTTSGADGARIGGHDFPSGGGMLYGWHDRDSADRLARV